MAAPAELSGLTDEAAYGACSEPDASTKVGWVGVTGAPRGCGTRSSPAPHGASPGGRAGHGRRHGGRAGRSVAGHGVALAACLWGSPSVGQPGRFRGRGEGRSGRAGPCEPPNPPGRTRPGPLLSWLSERYGRFGQFLPGRHKKIYQTAANLFTFYYENLVIAHFGDFFPPITSVNHSIIQFLSTWSFTSLLVYSYPGASRKYPYTVAGRFCCQDIIKLDRSSIPVP